MNGIKAYLSRDEVKKIVAEEVARRLEPQRMLGECKDDALFFDDGHIEVIFFTPDAVLEEGEVLGTYVHSESKEGQERERQREKERELARAKSKAKDQDKNETAAAKEHQKDQKMLVIS
ncbi:MAG TPA: hypothetical protein VJ924_13455 [Alphaproteobacteria bacterium]|nr:hypothetical protein [Alphaproteobacteria bacterium]